MTAPPRRWTRCPHRTQAARSRARGPARASPGARICWCTGQTGGHFGAGLGVVDLTIALHYCYNTPQDRLVWGRGPSGSSRRPRRKDNADHAPEGRLRRLPAPRESNTDLPALATPPLRFPLPRHGRGRENERQQHRSLRIIGDGAVTAGMAFEASRMLRIRDDTRSSSKDSGMSISKNVGGLSNYFVCIWASKTYIAPREGGSASAMPATNFTCCAEEKHEASGELTAVPFEDRLQLMSGPIDGLRPPISYVTISNLRERPQLLHVYTTKGKALHQSYDRFSCYTKIYQPSER
ncbi:MAG: 1-deoxy-D-xylulose-5-phosphate synthase N-terminal domain-containing protein [Polyangiaceae bacterium]